MKAKHFDVCVLGGGPSAMFANLMLQEKGYNVVNIAKRLYGALSPIEIESSVINVIPIFPVTNSEIWNFISRDRLHIEESVVIEYRHQIENIAGIQFDNKKDSYAEYLMNGNSNFLFSITLSQKLFGSRIYNKRLYELRMKVSRHYYDPNKAVNKRIGFVDGFSPYYTYLARKESRIALITEDISSIDMNKHIIKLKNQTILYDYIISTIYLPKLIEIIGVNFKISFTSDGAKFYVLKHSEGMDHNLVIYDCDIKSSIYRLFIPQRQIIVVQIARDFWGVHPFTISKYIHSFLDLNEMPVFIKPLALAHCYPLDVNDYSTKTKLEEYLKSNNILLFGRFGKWEYKDLHELSWGALYDSIKTS